SLILLDVSFTYEAVQCVRLIRKHLHDIEDVKNYVDPTTGHEIDVIASRVPYRELYNRTSTLQCLRYNYTSI
ncbi:MAG: hypothetical protein ACFFEE_05995, partial [Candidatus Thorarchaeota archaeon]